MRLEDILDELADPNLSITASNLVHLSGLNAEELILFKEGWLGVATDRRRKVTVRLSQLAEDNVELDFSEIFRYSLNDEDDELRVHAIEGLWECDERSLIGPLIRLLHDDTDDRVRAAAAQSLGRFAMLAELGQLLERDATRVGNSLLDTIDSEGETLEVRRRAIEAVAPMNVEGVAQIIQDAYDDDNLLVKASALYAMGLNCNPKWLPTLGRELLRDEPELRYEAVAAMGLIGDETAVPELLAMIGDPDAQIQAAVFNAIGAIGGTTAKKGLASALQHSDVRIVELAQEALSALAMEEEPMPFPAPRSRGSLRFLGYDQNPNYDPDSGSDS